MTIIKRFRIKRPQWFLLTSVFLIVSGCSTLKPEKIERPEIPKVEHWTVTESNDEKVVLSGLLSFQDARLEELLKAALIGNFDLQVTATRVEAARAQAKLVGAAIAPDWSASAKASRNFRNSALQTGREVYSNNFELGANVSWEVDLWEQLSNRKKAATWNYQASVTEQSAARLSLIANIARSWYNAIEAHLQIQLLEKRLVNQQENLEILEERFHHGINNALDVHLARASEASEKSRLFQKKAARESEIRSLEVLLGLYPSAQLPLAEKLPKLSERIPIGLPSDLLKRRPDIIAAEQRFKASEALTAAAYQNRFPSLRLTGTLGASNGEFHKLFSSDQLFGSLIAGIATPLFYGDELEAQEEESRAKARETAIHYARTVLNAFQEVEASLSIEKWLDQQETAIDVAMQEAQAGETLAFEQYQSGLVGFVTVLEAQRRAFDAQSTLIQIRNSRLQNRIRLHLALGGNFVETKELELETRKVSNISAGEK
ncbi:MAG: efflux transporter outer membrane subunit [SAR324 cluster bacterium]|nr:efflux transporter outer membrane subunit [SAR324 cluster bacterium]